MASETIGARPKAVLWSTGLDKGRRDTGISFEGGWPRRTCTSMPESVSVIRAVNTFMSKGVPISTMPPVWQRARAP